ncbi:MAG: hypothetical protein GWP05_11315, partial [Anaerolineaceae bacterium]|nr:hypothetical protein [Anaerolineaceae bacterium]
MSFECIARPRPVGQPACSLLAEVTISPGDITHWRAMASLHYRSHGLGGFDRLFQLRYGRDLIGVIVYCLPPANCAPRNRALKELVDRLPRRGRMRFWNGCLRTVSRVVVDPNWRGLGLAVRLVRETLPLAGVPYVEATAAMARLHPFFGRAGMTRYPVAAGPQAERMQRALEAVGIPRREVRSAAALQRAVEQLDGHTQEWLRGELQRWVRSYLGAKTAQTVTPTLAQTCGYAAR